MKTSGLFVVGVVLALLGGCGDDDDDTGTTAQGGSAGTSAQAGNAGSGGDGTSGSAGGGGDAGSAGTSGAAGSSAGAAGGGGASAGAGGTTAGTAGTAGAGGATGGSAGAGGATGGSSGASGQAGGGVGGACHQVTVDGAYVAATEVKTLPALQPGGLLAEGTYVLTSSQTTATELTAPTRMKLVLTATPGDLDAKLTTQLEGVADAQTYAGSVKLTGATQVTFTWTCPSGQEPWVRGFSSDGKTTMTLETSGMAYIFTKQ